MIGKWFKTVMYKEGWGTARNQVIVIRFFSVYSSYFYCGLEAASSDCTSGDDHSNGNKRKFGDNFGCDSSSGNMNDLSGNIPSSFLIQRSEEVLKMLEEDETWSSSN